MDFSTAGSCRDQPEPALSRAWTAGAGLWKGPKLPGWHIPILQCTVLQRACPSSTHTPHPAAPLSTSHRMLNQLGVNWCRSPIPTAHILLLKFRLAPSPEPPSAGTHFMPPQSMPSAGPMPPAALRFCLGTMCTVNHFHDIQGLATALLTRNTSTAQVPVCFPICTARPAQLTQTRRPAPSPPLQT